MGDSRASPNEVDGNGHKEGIKIATFVFMDIEATSLLDGRQKPRILELCFVAVHRADLELSIAQRGVFPRVINKLTLCVDPGKPISYGASQITGLYNDTLENQKRLTDKTAILINAFLAHLAKPVCLLAHNGNGYDFPLLQAELARIKQALPDDIYCADTLEAFRSLDGLLPRHSPLTNQNNNQDSTPKSTQIIFQNPPPVGLKRKSLQGDTDSNVTGIKVAKHNTEQFDVVVPASYNVQGNVGANKVKKKLFVDEIKSESNNNNHIEDDGKKHTDDSNNKSEEIDEFASSLENEDYFIALEAAERHLSTPTNNLIKVDAHTSIKEGSMGKRSDKISDPEDGNGNIQQQFKPCGVQVGTGYFVRNPINHTAAKEGEEPCKINRNEIKNIVESKKKELENVVEDKGVIECLNESTPSSSLAESNTLTPAESASTLSYTLAELSQVSLTAQSSFKQSDSEAESILPQPISSSSPAVSSSSPAISSSSPAISSSPPISSSSPPISSSSPAISSSSPAISSSLPAISSSSPPISSSSPPISSSTLVSSTSFGRPKVQIQTASSTDLPNVQSLSNGSERSPTSSNISSTRFVSNNFTPSRPIVSPSSSSQVGQGYHCGKRLSYKLGEIYLRKYGSKPEVVHSAEGDCLTMLKICSRSPGIISWLDEHAVLFSNTKPAY